VETVTVVQDLADCEPSFTATQIVIADGTTFFADPVIVTPQSEPTVITFGYSEFTLNMLSTIGFVEVVGYFFLAEWLMLRVKLG